MHLSEWHLAFRPCAALATDGGALEVMNVITKHVRQTGSSGSAEEQVHSEVHLMATMEGSSTSSTVSLCMHDRYIEIGRLLYQTNQ
jgi:hypothetical protein